MAGRLSSLDPVDHVSLTDDGRKLTALLLLARTHGERQFFALPEHLQLHVTAYGRLVEQGEEVAVRADGPAAEGGHEVPRADAGPLGRAVRGNLPDAGAAADAAASRLGRDHHAEAGPAHASLGDEGEDHAPERAGDRNREAYALG